VFPRFPRSNEPARPDGPGAKLTAGMAAGAPEAWQRALRFAERACCCPAKPAVVALMPPAPGRSRAVDLLLCRHHYLASRKALAAAGATVFDPRPQSPEDVIPTTSEAAQRAAARARHPSSLWRTSQTPDA
jgi:hypothetical protein